MFTLLSRAKSQARLNTEAAAVKVAGAVIVRGVGWGLYLRAVQRIAGYLRRVT